MKKVNQTCKKLGDYLTEPRSFSDLRKELKISDSSIYRYLDRLVDKGVQLIRLSSRRPTQYLILQDAHSSEVMIDLETYDTAILNELGEADILLELENQFEKLKGSSNV